MRAGALPAIECCPSWMKMRVDRANQESHKHVQNQRGTLRTVAGLDELRPAREQTYHSRVSLCTGTDSVFDSMDVESIAVEYRG